MVRRSRSDGSVEAPITLAALILSPKVARAPGLARTALAFPPLLVDLIVRDSAGPDPATRTGSSIVEETRLGLLPPLLGTAFLAGRIVHRCPPPA
jgi:hypothetical protein